MFRLILARVSAKKDATKKATSCDKKHDIYPPIYIGGIKCLSRAMEKKILVNVKSSEAVVVVGFASIC